MKKPTQKSGKAAKPAKYKAGAMPAGQVKESAAAKVSRPKVSYSGTITTTGTSEAIRLEKALFRSHPEFRQKAKVKARVVAPGHLLVSVEDPALEAETDEAEDPILGAFLSFLDADMEKHPDRIKPLDEEKWKEWMRLTENVVVNDDDVIPDDITFPRPR